MKPDPGLSDRFTQSAWVLEPAVLLRLPSLKNGDPKAKQHQGEAFKVALPSNLLEGLEPFLILLDLFGLYLDHALAKALEFGPDLTAMPHRAPGSAGRRGG